MTAFKSLLGTMRIPFLVLAPACVAVGVATAYSQMHVLVWYEVVLVLVGALASHVCVNVLNEYFDGKSGLDARTRRTPFSGGSGTLPLKPELQQRTLYLGLGALAVVVLVGLYFTWLRGWQLLPLGILGIALLVTYTSWLAYEPVLCLIAPGLGFGVFMVMGTHFALTGTYTWQAFIASLVPTFLVSDLLLLNQFPDVEADQTVGRRHFPITIGRKSSAILYGVLLLLTYLSVLTGVLLGLLPRWSLLAMLTIVPALQAYRGAYRNAEDVPALIPSMALNVLVNVTAPILLSIGVFIG